jgi:hypothetical protein
MYQNVPPDGKLDEAGTRKLEDGRPRKPIATQIPSESSISIRPRSQSSGRYAEIVSALNFGDQVVVCLSGTDSRKGQKLP